MNSSKNHKDITIVIVLYCESYDLVFETLNYLGSFKKIIIDNSNNINLKKKIENNFRIDQYILNKKNNGFSAGHNQGIKLSSTKYTMLLGPDCIIKEKDILNLIDVLINNENCFIVAPTSYDKKMNLTYTGGPLPENGDKNIVLNLSGNVCIQSVLGACMLFQTKKLIDSGLLFDENFFLYFSDDDLCRRVSKIGNHIIQSFNSKCIHQHGIVKEKNIYIKKFIREYNLAYDKYYYFYKINKHTNMINQYKKRIPLMIFRFFLKILIFNFLSAVEIASKLLAFYRFKFKILNK